MSTAIHVYHKAESQCHGAGIRCKAIATHTMTVGDEDHQDVPENRFCLTCANSWKGDFEFDGLEVVLNEIWVQGINTQTGPSYHRAGTESLKHTGIFGN